MSYSKEKWKGGTLLAPVPPALVTCRDNGKDNVLTIAWTGIINTIPPKTYISVRPERYSYDLIRNSGVFAINLTTEALVKACDFCGVRSGTKVDKFKETGLCASDAFSIDAPILDDSPVTLECMVTDVIELGSHHMFLADIVSVDVAKELIDPSGRLALEKSGLLAYCHGEYYSLGKRLGSFGFSVRKKKKKRRK